MIHTSTSRLLYSLGDVLVAQWTHEIGAVDVAPVHAAGLKGLGAMASAFAPHQSSATGRLATSVLLSHGWAVFLHVAAEGGACKGAVARDCLPRSLYIHEGRVWRSVGKPDAVAGGASRFCHQHRCFIQPGPRTNVEKKKKQVQHSRA